MKKYKLQFVRTGETVILVGYELPPVPVGWKLLTITK